MDISPAIHYLQEIQRICKDERKVSKMSEPYYLYFVRMSESGLYKFGITKNIENRVLNKQHKNKPIDKHRAHLGYPSKTYTFMSNYTIIHALEQMLLVMYDHRHVEGEYLHLEYHTAFALRNTIQRWGEYDWYFEYFDSDIPISNDEIQEWHDEYIVMLDKIKTEISSFLLHYPEQLYKSPFKNFIAYNLIPIGVLNELNIIDMPDIFVRYALIPMMVNLVRRNSTINDDFEDIEIANAVFDYMVESKMIDLTYFSGINNQSPYLYPLSINLYLEL